MRLAIQSFGERLEHLGPNAVGLFYYAGHAVQSNGKNYLIPVGASISREPDLEDEAVSADAVLAQMKYAGARVNLLILDACRDNPFRSFSRSLSQGLAQMKEAPHGSLIAYSTAPGEVADDGDGWNSPYSAALAKAMQVDGEPVEDVFKRVRASVWDATGNRQLPWESSSLFGDFYFKGSRKDSSGRIGETNASAPNPANLAPNEFGFGPRRRYRQPAERDDAMRVQSVHQSGGGGAIWLFEGKHGQAMWRYGAIADLTVESFDGRNVVIDRSDPIGSYSSAYAPPGQHFVARYKGTIHGDRIDGTVTWMNSASGKWYAIIRKSLCRPFKDCPLSANQVFDLGQNAARAGLHAAALQSYLIAASQGNAAAGQLADKLKQPGTAANNRP